MSLTNTSHFVLFTVPAWGHLRPFCVFATRLVREREDIVVTLVVVPHILDKTRTEVSRQFFNESSESAKAALQRIRILSPHLPDLNNNSLNLHNATKILSDTYPVTYQTLYQAKPITCSATGTTFSAVPAPCAVIIDHLALTQLRVVRALSGDSVPIVIFMAAGAGAMIRLYGPESIGGQGDVGARIDAEAARTGLSHDKVGPKIFSHSEGKLVEIPGLPAMYDYEFLPQTLPDPNALPAITNRGYISFRECDAIIGTTSYIYESASLDAMKQGFSDMQKEVHILGPLLPAGYGTEPPKTEEGVNSDIEAFLAEMLKRHGKRSVFFVSFGTLAWPPVSEYVDELIEALIQKNAPFIFAYAADRAKLSEQQIERIKSSGLGMSTTWSPQQFVLNHPATGWFVTHGGFNSITESLGSGIPLICWPFAADQPVAAAHATENLQVAFELFQVRTGDGLKRIYRNGLTPKGTREAVGIEIRQTIDLCRGEKGDELRKNAETIKVKFAKAWDEDGIARQEMRKFLHRYT